MTKNKIAIFISIVIIGCIALGVRAYYSAGTMSQGYKDVSKMDWSLKLSDKYIGISSSPVDGEFYFRVKNPDMETKEGVIDYKGNVILPPAVSISSAGDGWYSIMDEFGMYTYRNTKGITSEEWTFTTPLYFIDQYAIVARSDGQQMIMSKKGEIVRKLNTKKLALGISKDYYNLYDKKAKRLQVLDMKTDEVVFESDKYRYISDLNGKCYVAVTEGDFEKIVLLGKDFKTLFDGRKFESAIGDGKEFLLVTEGEKSFYLDMKENRVATELKRFGTPKYPFSEGIAVIYGFDKVRGIDTAGKVLFEKPYLGVESSWMGGGSSRFSDGLAPLTEDVYHWGYVNKTGEYVVKPIFDEVSEAKGGYAAVRLDEMWGILCL